MRRKCDGYIFQTGYGRGIDNTADAISRIEEWGKADNDRFETVNDHTDIDDDSIEINNAEIIIKSDLEQAILEVNNLTTQDITTKSANMKGALSNS